MAFLADHEVVQLKKRLDERDAALRAEIRDILTRAGEARWSELAGSVHDLADESVADMLADFDDARVHRHIGELRAIEGARARIAQGSYGRCAGCGGEIGYPRLAAQPTAARCVACQGQHEKTYAHDETPRL